MEKLARDFNLSFQSLLPPYMKFYLTFFRDVEINRVGGKIGKHYLTTTDIYRGNVFNIRYSDHQTLIQVDGKEVTGSIENFTLANSFFLTTVSELRQFFQNLND
jgi:hypothetical protein